MSQDSVARAILEDALRRDAGARVPHPIPSTATGVDADGSIVASTPHAGSVEGRAIGSADVTTGDAALSISVGANGQDLFLIGGYPWRTQ